MDENSTKIVIAITSAITGALVTRILTRPTEKRKGAAAYLEAICVSLAGMVECFEKNEIPHRYGHAFIASLESFLPIVEPVVGADALRHLMKLDSLARTALTIDSEMLNDFLPPESVNKWVIDAKRVLGELEGLIAKLKGRS